MEKFPLTVKNILKMLIWIGLIFTFLEIFGLILGIIFYVLFVLVWSILLTLIRNYLNTGTKDLKEIIQVIFTTNPTLPFTAYGCYCSPKYGEDGRTQGLEPVDGLDNSCKKHDDAMILANEAFGNGALSKADYVRLKNLGDWTFMKRAIVSENSASGIYLIGLLISFTLRIIGRSI